MMVPVVVQQDPITSFLWGYSEYILVGFGVLMLLVFIRRFVIPWLKGERPDELKIIDSGVKDDGTEEE